MMRLTLGLTAALIALGAVASAQAQSARPAIESAGERFENAFNNGDAAGIAAEYTEDGALLPPDSPRVDGRKGIQSFWQGLIDAGLSDLDLTTTEVEESGDSAYEIGTFSLTAPGENGGSAEVAGKYLVVWHKGADGAWRLHRDIWNTPPAE